jgi:hypothetical protein
LRVGSDKKNFRQGQAMAELQYFYYDLRIRDVTLEEYESCVSSQDITGRRSTTIPKSNTVSGISNTVLIN